MGEAVEGRESEGIEKGVGESGAAWAGDYPERHDVPVLS